MLKKTAIGAAVIVAVLAVLYVQRDFIYGVKGNLGQGTHPRF